MKEYQIIIVIGSYQAKTSQIVHFPTKEIADAIADKISKESYPSTVFVMKLY